MGLVRRHGISFVEDANDDLTLVGLARDDRENTVLGLFDRLFPNVEPQPRLAGVRVEPVAVKAGVRHDGPYVTVEGNLCGSRRLRSMDAGQGDEGNAEYKGDFVHQEKCH